MFYKKKVVFVLRVKSQGEHVGMVGGLYKGLDSFFYLITKFFVRYKKAVGY